MAQEVSLDFNQITPRMFIEFKDKTGTSLMEMVDDAGEIDMQAMSGELLAGCIWLALRVSGQPDATWDDALDTPFSALTFVDDDEPDPTNASSAT